MNIHDKYLMRDRKTPLTGGPIFIKFTENTSERFIMIDQGWSYLIMTDQPWSFFLLLKVDRLSMWIFVDPLVTFLTQLEEFRVNFGTIVGCVTTKGLVKHDKLLINVDQPWSTIIAGICFQWLKVHEICRLLVTDTPVGSRKPQVCRSSDTVTGMNYLY